METTLDIQPITIPGALKHKRAGNGGYLERKANGETVYHTPWTKQVRPFSMPALKPRIDKTPAVTIARIKADIIKTDDRDVMARFQGKNFGAWDIVATDGHRALLLPATGNEKPAQYGTMFDFSDHTVHATFNDPVLHLAVKRAGVMSPERSRLIKLTFEASALTLGSEDSDFGTFEETYALNHDVSPLTIGFNWKFIEPCLGLWPMTFSAKDNETVCGFMPIDGSFLYAVMPIKF